MIVIILLILISIFIGPNVDNFDAEQISWNDPGGFDDDGFFETPGLEEPIEKLPYFLNFMIIGLFVTEWLVLFELSRCNKNCNKLNK